MKRLIAIILTLSLILALPVLAHAKFSPGGQYEIKVNEIQTNGGEIEGHENEDGTYTITAKPDKEYKFVKWNIQGEYEIVDGTETSITVRFDYTTDININAIWAKKGSTTSTGPVDSGSGSPETTDNSGNILPIALTLLVGFASVAGFIIIKGKHVNEQ